jgi:SAM-dependent methyltransferase
VSKSTTASVAYSDAFFDWQQDGALRSARLIAPIVQRVLNPQSVIDIGCGRGAWLRAFSELGVRSIRGLDGDYVDRTRLMIAEECFTQTDLGRPFDAPGRSDLAVCLEVAEHLPREMAATLVETLVNTAPAVLFSAALPGQGGTHHINEQMPAYWRRLFARYGYVLLDPIRPAILTDARIEPWYRQNIVLYVSDSLLRSRAELEAHRMPEDGMGIEWVQAYILGHHESVRSLSRQLGAALGRALGRRLRWH